MTDPDAERRRRTNIERETAYMEAQITQHRSVQNFAALGALATGVFGGLSALTRSGRRSLGFDPQRVPWIYLTVIVVSVGALAGEAAHHRAQIAYLTGRVDAERRLVINEPWLRTRANE
jgi:hypothetical protein